MKMPHFNLALRIAAIAFCGLYFSMAQAEAPSRPFKNFDSAKRVARDAIYLGYEKTFYCDCDFQLSRTKSGGIIDPDRCGYEPRKNPKRGAQLEWEHVVPAAIFGRSKACWKKGHTKCVKADGTPFKGRSCCSKVDKSFREAEADLHNLTPAVGELNGDRSDLRYGLVPGEQREYGRCDFEIGGTPRVAEPREAIRGDAARIWFYMADTYGVKLTTAEKIMYKEWLESDPPNQRERLRDMRIEAAQGNVNPYVQ